MPADALVTLGNHMFLLIQTLLFSSKTSECHRPMLLPTKLPEIAQMNWKYKEFINQLGKNLWKTYAWLVPYQSNPPVQGEGLLHTCPTISLCLGNGTPPPTELDHCGKKERSLYHSVTLTLGRPNSFYKHKKSVFNNFSSLRCCRWLNSILFEDMVMFILQSISCVLITRALAAAMLISGFSTVCEWVIKFNGLGMGFFSHTRWWYLKKD